MSVCYDSQVILNENNYAFIDAQNVVRGISALGWKIDWGKFRIYLREKYSATKAFIFIGKINSYKRLYDYLRGCGYVLVFKPTTRNKKIIKGNCDGDLILHALTNNKYDMAIIVSSDGDFYSLVRYLRKKRKLKVVLSPHANTCSKLLKYQAKGNINYMNQLKEKLSEK